MHRRGKNPYRGDRFTAKAKEEGYAARSVYKLQEIQRRTSLLRRGQRVVDLGCHPGSWARYVAEQVGDSGVVVGVDLEETAIPRGRFLHRSVMELTPQELNEALGGLADVVLSDMAPRTTGDTFGDHVRQIELAQQAVHLALGVLRVGGHLVLKVFDGEDAHAFVQSIRPHFTHVKRVKPEAVRQVSREFFLVCTERRG